MSGAPQVWTIGHSNHSIDEFIDLLRGAGIEVVADVRSQPFSRYSAHFNQHGLKAALVAAGVRYVFLGKELGGRPPEPSMYDADGHVLYGEVAKSARFRSGLDRVIEGAARWRVALMCSEESPVECHRRLLVARVLRDRAVQVTHIRRGGATVDDEVLTTQLGEAEQPTLFGEGRGEEEWRSVRSVSRGTPPRSSSSH